MQASAVEFVVSFRGWISLKVAEDCLEELGCKNYYPVPRGDEVTLVVSVPGGERKEWERKISAQPEVDTVRIVR